MDLKIQPVGIDYVAQTWPFVETYLKEALEKGEPVPEWSNNYDLSHVQGNPPDRNDIRVVNRVIISFLFLQGV